MDSVAIYLWVNENGENGGLCGMVGKSRDSLAPISQAFLGMLEIPSRTG